jgi:membrane protein implicated in regulation of membrane protease activity
MLEMLAPTGHTLWLGVSGLIVGTLLWLFPTLSWQLQLLLFAVLSVVAVLTYKRFAPGDHEVTDAPNLNRRSEQYIGRVFSLQEPIENGVGKITVDDTIWRIYGQDLPVGSRVKVVRVDTANMYVEEAK